MAFNKSCLNSAAAKGFYAHRAAAGKEIKKTRSFGGALHHIENGFAQHGGCRAGLSAAGRLEKEAAVFTAENAQAHPRGVFVLAQEGRAFLPEDIVRKIDELAEPAIL